MIGVSEFVGGGAQAQALLDAMPSPVFVLDEELNIVGLNEAARQVIEAMPGAGPASSASPLDCVQGSRPGGGGEDYPARNFGLSRHLVADAFAGRKAVRRRAWARLGTPAGGMSEVEMFLSATRVEIGGRFRVLLVVEELSAPAKADGIIAICARCKKLRDEQNRWRSPERFLAERFGVRLTHGLCPDCLESSLAEIGTEHDEFV